jgi:phosphoribosylanthranilate isomerase
MHIKICGLTNLDDALAALDAGADCLGFNFYPKSPRYLPPDDCARIISSLRAPVTTVGVFVNEPPARVAALLDHCGLDLAQLHGDEPPEYLTLLWGRAYKAFRGAADGVGFADFARISPGAPALLMDAHVPNAFGGTGRLADWAAARALAARFPIFLAGGLAPENVAQAIAQVQPWGVDVASGVESAPGRKDQRKMRAFVKAVCECVSV